MKSLEFQHFVACAMFVVNNLIGQSWFQIGCMDTTCLGQTIIFQQTLITKNLGKLCWPVFLYEFKEICVFTLHNSRAL